MCFFQFDLEFGFQLFLVWFEILCVFFSLIFGLVFSFFSLVSNLFFLQFDLQTSTGKKRKEN